VVSDVWAEADCWSHWLASWASAKLSSQRTLSLSSMRSRLRVPGVCFLRNALRA
jgi:hypothetical protein